MNVTLTPGQTLTVQSAAQPLVSFGGYNPAAGQGTAAAWLAAIGTKAALIHWYQDMEHGPFVPDTARMDEVIAAGGMPLLSLELDNYQNGANQPAYANAVFAAGDHDLALTAYCKALAAWGKPCLLRPFWEMSGQWYPWSTMCNGNTPGSFIDAWRHVAALVRQYAPLARLVWCPSVDLPGIAPLEDCYPGDRWVEYLGLDGYNKGPANPGGAWWSFQQVFGPSYQRLVALSGKPILICETGCHTVGGDRPGWFSAIPAALATMPQVVGVCLFTNMSGSQDYTLTDPATLAAVKALAASPLMAGRL